MFSKYKYTDKEEKELLDSIVILVDSREKSNLHITQFFDKKNIAWKKMGMKQGDYSCYLPENEKLNIDRDIYFDKEVVLERKNSLEELSTTFTASRVQFENELIRSRNLKFSLMVECSGGWDEIVANNYNTKYNRTSYLATLFTYYHRHNMSINFISKENAGSFIYQHMYYFLREYLR